MLVMTFTVHGGRPARSQKKILNEKLCHVAHHPNIKVFVSQKLNAANLM